MLGRYLAGAALARTGDELSGPAVLLLGISVTGTPGAASALLTGLTASSALGGPVFGAFLDRVARPGLLLAATLAWYALGLALVLLALGHLPLPAVVTLAVVTGLGNPAVSGGWTSQLPAAPGDLPRATALDAATFNVASLAGPALAAVVADRFGAATAVAVAAAMMALAMPAAWSLPARRTSRGRAHWTAGLTVLVRRRALLRATVTSTISYGGLGMVVVCYPLVGASRLGGASRGALLLAVVAGAALLTDAVLARRPWRGRPDTLVFASTVVLATSAVGTALGGPVLLVLSAVLAGLAEGPQLTALFAVRHREAPEHLRAQVFTIGASVKITGFAAGTALGGALAGSPTTCLLAVAAVQLAAAAAYAAVRTPSPVRGA
ncbi:MFS transporter [Amycolatopsis sacchari]|uniref:MFS transporter n=1 Tax=Amycolatopsis sacchari TaxID=115433 RepID=UPI001FE9F0C1|nr:MFS transporter [Amycolatopsis sacchari]